MSSVEVNTTDLVKSDCADYSLHIGTTFEVEFQLIQECSELPVDLSGYTATMVVFSDDETILTMAGDMTDHDNGMVLFTATPTETDDLTAGIYKYHANITIGSTVYRIAEGNFEVAI